MHPKVKWSLILFGVLVIFAPLAAVGLFQWLIDTVGMAFHSIGIFLNGVVPKK